MALGRLLLPASLGSRLGVPSAILLASGLTSALVAMIAVGSAPAAVWAAMLVAMVSLAVGWRSVFGDLRWLIAEVKRLTVSSVGLVLSGGVGLLFWLVAITPPRDADVMRYHLAHIRQIRLDGAWLPIPDYTYAFPFGWSLSYLPFEYVGLPEGAHLLNLGLWALSVVLLFGMTAELAPPWAARAVCALFAVQPLILKSATTAHADMYTVFTMLSPALLLIGYRGAPSVHIAWPLGFATWIGVQSRYQAVAPSLALSLLVLGMMVIRTARGAGWKALARHLAGFSGGGALALALAAPFYVFNAVAFGNPVWPLLVPALNGLERYADRVVNWFGSGFTGQFSVQALISGVPALFRDELVFPIPVAVIVLIGIAPLWRGWVARSMAALCALFTALWVVGQPGLYPRYILPLITPAALGLSDVLGGVLRVRGLRWVGRAVAACLAVGSIGFLAFDVFYAADSLRYVATGNLREYHRYTWFWGAYDWVNRTASPDERLLVITYSGHTFHLNRPYRRADPLMSGVVDWSRVRSGSDLLQLMREQDFDAILYEERDWSGYEGGLGLCRSVHEAVTQRDLLPREAFETQLYVSRIRREFIDARMWLLVRLDARSLAEGPAGASTRWVGCG